MFIFSSHFSLFSFTTMPWQMKIIKVIDHELYHDRCLILLNHFFIFKKDIFYDDCVGVILMGVVVMGMVVDIMVVLVVIVVIMVVVMVIMVVVVVIMVVVMVVVIEVVMVIFMVIVGV